MQVTLQGQPFNTFGEMPRVGEKAPEFGGVRADLSVLKLSELLGKRVVLNVFPSLDTPVCAASVRKFNKAASELKDTVVLCVSKDLPFAQGRFCAAEGLENVIPVSTFRCNCFRDGYGLEIADGPMRGLEARAVIVIDEKGTIIYEQLVSEITNEPDYETTLAVLR